MTAVPGNLTGSAEEADGVTPTSDKHSGVSTGALKNLSWLTETVPSVPSMSRRRHSVRSAIDIGVIVKYGCVVCAVSSARSELIGLEQKSRDAFAVGLFGIYWTAGIVHLQLAINPVGSSIGGARKPSHCLDGRDGSPPAVRREFRLDHEVTDIDITEVELVGMEAGG